MYVCLIFRTVKLKNCNQHAIFHEDGQNIMGGGAELPRDQDIICYFDSAVKYSHGTLRARVSIA